MRRGYDAEFSLCLGDRWRSVCFRWKRRGRNIKEALLRDRGLPLGFDGRACIYAALEAPNDVVKEPA